MEEIAQAALTRLLATIGLSASDSGGGSINSETKACWDHPPQPVGASLPAWLPRA